MEIQIGNTYTSNKCGDFTIKEILNSSKILVKFNKTGYEKWTTRVNIKKGSIKDFNHPSVYGRGYIGEGFYNSKDYPLIYQRWSVLLQRCYSSKSQSKRKTYEGCYVCEEWLNFQNFAKWFEENYPCDTTQDYHLDKDSIVEGNKVYSPETCCFLTASENSGLSKAKYWTFISPSGLLVNIHSLRKFCNDNGLSSQCMHLVSKGKQDHHKGWRLP